VQSLHLPHGWPGRQHADIDAIENVCRCGTYGRIREAIKAAAAAMR
jgi:aerobic-type carbon monoxide dehydrogenase small subunit (CoxS/CutS family)